MAVYKVVAFVNADAKALASGAARVTQLKDLEARKHSFGNSSFLQGSSRQFWFPLMKLFCSQTTERKSGVERAQRERTKQGFYNSLDDDGDE